MYKIFLLNIFVFFIKFFQIKFFSLILFGQKVIIFLSAIANLNAVEGKPTIYVGRIFKNSTGSPSKTLTLILLLLTILSFK